MNPAVVVVAYNRPVALRRLLDSLLRASYPGIGVPLVISIDRATGPDADEVRAIADAFAWPFGPKEVIQQPRHLGLVAHFHACGRLAVQHGAAVILEDDLTVAPPFYDFASQVLERYDGEPRVGGVCLYGLWFNGFTREPFQPVDDGWDVFFLGLPYTQGLAFTAAQWQSFEAGSLGSKPGPHPGLHPSFQRFGPDEWFPSLAYYLVAAGRFFCMPRVSLTTGWGDEGTHFPGCTSWFQTPLQLRSRPAALPAFEDALAVYDSFFELLPEKLRLLSPSLPAVDFDVDLNATKRSLNLQHDYVLTSRPVRRALTTYGLLMYPPERNVIEAVPGADLALARRDDVYWDAAASLEARRRLHAYGWARHRPSRRRSAAFVAARVITGVRRWWLNRT